MTTAEIKQLKINGVDSALIRRCKYAALDRGITLREFVIEAIDRHARETAPPLAGRSRRPPPGKG